MDRMKEILERIAAIEVELRSEDSDPDALKVEYDGLKAEMKGIEDKAETRKKLLDDVAHERKGTPVTNINIVEERTFDSASPEYRSAFYKKLAKEAGVVIRSGSELSEIEQRAYTHTTGNTGAVVPLNTINRIKELVSSWTTLLDDVVIDKFVQQYEVPRHTAIAAGDAAIASEGSANESDEQDTFDTIPLAGQDIVKHIEVTENLMLQSIDAFEDWIVRHIIQRIYHRMNATIYAELEDAQYGIKAANKFAVASLDEATVRSALAAIKGDGASVIYANQATIYGAIAAVQDTTGRPLFLQSTYSDNPLIVGRAYSAQVKLDDSLANNIIWVGKPGEIAANEFEAPNVMTDIDVKTRKRIFGGFAKFDTLPMRDDCFAKITITPTPLSSEAKITAFSIGEATGAVTESAKTIAVTVPNGTTVTALTAVFTASAGSSVFVGGVKQVSGTTKNDFTSSVVYTVVPEDDSKTVSYTVTVTEAQG